MGPENTQRNLLDLNAVYLFLLPLAIATTELQDPPIYSHAKFKI